MLTRKVRGFAGCTQHRRSIIASANNVAEQRTSFRANDTFQWSPIINGCWQLAGGHGREVFENIQEKLVAHADAGFTTFDTADIYGPSERVLGDFVASRRSSGKPPVQVFTKYVPNIFHSRVTPAAVEAAVRKSMANLQVEQLDLVQLHWWDYDIPGMVDTALGLADCQAKGLIRYVGTTNMDCEAMVKILDAGCPVVVNQVQFSILDRRPLSGMLQLAQDKSFKLLTYGSVGGGLLSDKYVVDAPKAGFFGGARYPNVDLNTSSLKMYWNVVRMFGGQELWRELLRVMKSIADKHDVSVANVALRWVMQQGDRKSVFPIVGLRSAAHVQDNARVFSFSLDSNDLAALQEVLQKSFGPAGDIYSFERGG